MSKSAKHSNQRGEGTSSKVAENAPDSSIVKTAAPKSTNYKKYLTEFVEYANEGIHSIHSSINSFQSIDILQKFPHAHEEVNLFAPITQKFLGDYSLQDIYRGFDKYGMKNELEKKGYKDIVISIDTSDYFVHKLSITDKSLSSTVKFYNGQFLIDLFVRKKDFILSDFKTYQLLRRIETFHCEKKFFINDKQIEKINYVDGFGAKELYKFMENQLNDKYSLSLIEWICMQDPYSEFSQNRPQFPGQNYPGLRIGRKFGNMLIDLLAYKGRDGLSNIPEHFHNAYIYHKQNYTFLNPAFQAYFDCLCDSLKNDLNVHGLSAVSWAFHNGHVKNYNSKIEIWNPEEQVYPTSSKLRLYFVSYDYKRLYNIFYKRGYQVSIDWENAKEIWKFSLNHEFNETANNHFGNEIDGDDIAEDVNVIEDKKEFVVNIIEDVTNQHHQNEYIWNLEKSKI